ncbi:hypothetical protein BGZ72_007021 [Mortierella alpina]|nr:hypothetical protein BGZ72_007021 [Mortierella alpina]
MIDDVSHTRKITRRREKWLAENEPVKEALKELSRQENVFQKARITREVDDIHKVRSKHRELLRGFENSGKRLKDLHNQRLRTKRTWSKVAAAERRYVQDHARSNDPSLGAAPPPAPAIIPPVPKSASIPPAPAAPAGPGQVSPVDGWCTRCNSHHIPARLDAKGFRRL